MHTATKELRKTANLIENRKISKIFKTLQSSLISILITITEIIRVDQEKNLSKVSSDNCHFLLFFKDRNICRISPHISRV